MLPPAEFIKRIRPFSFVSEKEIAILMSGLEVEVFSENETIYTKGQSRSSVYIIFSGIVGIYEDDMPLDRYSRGEVFGIAPARGDPYSTTARALEEVICYVIPADRFHDVLERNERFASFFSSFVGRRFRLFRNIALEGKVPEEAVLAQEIGQFAYKGPIICGHHSTVRDVVCQMDRYGASAVLIADAEGNPSGIFTQQDLRKAVMGGDIGDKASRYMSSPVKSSEMNATVFDALAVMMESEIDHLVMTREGKVTGLITRSDIQTHLDPIPFISSLFGRISKAISVEELRRIYASINKSIAKLTSAGFSFYGLTRLITSVHDRLLIKVIEAQVGASAFHDFTWLNMGSSGRKEQVIATDQDNALVFRGKEPGAFSEHVVETLAQMGVAKCRSGFMASNPEWSQSLSVWQEYFKTWFQDPVPNHVRYLSIFLDLRPIAGDRGLYHELADWIRWNITSKAIRHLAHDAIAIEPPLGISGILGLITGVDLKTFAIYPLVNGVRVLAIDSDMVQITNTLERIEGLKARGVLEEEMCRDLSEAYAFLQDLRLKHHSRSVLENKQVDNRIRVKELGKVDLLILKETLKIIASFQKLLMKKYDVKRPDSYITSILVGPASPTGHRS